MKPTVLVVDDEKTFRIVAEEALSSEGFTVTTAASGQAGLQAWQREPTDLVILDRHLPDTDGIAVLVSRGVDTRVDHCELDGVKGRGISIKPDPARPDALLRPRIDHHWLHDWAGEPGANVHEPIQIGQTLAHTDIPVGAIVERNLLERVSVDSEAISIKCSDNIVRGNTLTGQTPKGQDIQFSWWNRIRGVPGMVQREPFTLSSLRDNGFDFTVYDSYQVCRIDKVHKEVKADV